MFIYPNNVDVSNRLAREMLSLKQLHLATLRFSILNDFEREEVKEQ